VSRLRNQEISLAHAALRFFATGPVKQLVTENIMPGPAVLPTNASNSDVAAWLTTACESLMMLVPGTQ
jgi:hypothetical protein